MKYLMVFPAMVVVGFLLVANPAQADVVHLKSKIADVNTETNYLKLYHLDTQREKVEEIKVDIDASTQFSGAASLRDLSVGEEVAVEANFDRFTNGWKALEVRRTAFNRLRQVAIEEAPRPVRDSAKVSGKSLAKVSLENTG